VIDSFEFAEVDGDHSFAENQPGWRFRASRLARGKDAERLGTWLILGVNNDLIDLPHINQLSLNIFNSNHSAVTRISRETALADLKKAAA
jgi:hypothetical protein